MNPDDGRVVSNFIVQAIKGEDLTVYGDGSQSRSFQYIDDLIEGMLRMMGTKDDVTGPVNIGNPDEFTVKELAALVIRLTGSKSKIIYKPLPQDDPIRRQPDISLANRLLDDWKPSVPLEEGLLRTINYFNEII
jgi:UDP-glucuronate decarboxylase